MDCLVFRVPTPQTVEPLAPFSVPSGIRGDLIVLSGYDVELMLPFSLPR